MKTVVSHHQHTTSTVSLLLSLFKNISDRYRNHRMKLLRKERSYSVIVHHNLASCLSSSCSTPSSLSKPECVTFNSFTVLPLCFLRVILHADRSESWTLPGWTWSRFFLGRKRCQAEYLDCICELSVNFWQLLLPKPFGRTAPVFLSLEISGWVTCSRHHTMV